MEDLAGHQTGDRPVAVTHERMSGGGLSSSPPAATERRSGFLRALPFRPSTRTPSLRSGNAARAWRNRSDRSARARTPVAAARALLASGFVLALGAAPAAAQTISIADTETYEGSPSTSPSRTLDFTVSLDAPATGAYTVPYTVTDGTATQANNDYTGTSGNVSFASGESSATISVTVNGDDAREADETLTVTLGTLPSGLTRGDGDATGTILADDFWVRFGRKVVVGSQIFHTTHPDYGLTQAEGEDTRATFANTVAHIDLRGQVPSSGTVRVVLRENGGSATLGTDYTITPENLTFDLPKPDGSRTGNSNDDAYHHDSFLTVIGDEIGEPDDTILLAVGTMTLLDSNDMVVPDATLSTLRTDGTDFNGISITLTNDDGDIEQISHQLAIEAASVTEGGTLSFPVNLTDAATSEVTFDYTVTGETAEANDYTHTDTSGTIASGADSTTIDIQTTADDVYEGDETLTVTITSAVGATIMVATGTGTIVDDESRPQISFNMPSVQEGDAGATTTLTFTATVNPVAEQQVSLEVELATDSGTATVDVDYPEPVIPGIRLPSLQSTASWDVEITGDDTVEPDETVFWHIKRVIGDADLDTSTLVMASSTATLKAGTNWLARGTILNDDVPPVQIGATSLSVLEGDSGLTPFTTWEVTLDRAASAQVTVDYVLSGASLTSDWQGDGSGTLTFGIGETSKTIPSLSIVGDMVAEPDEDVIITLADPTGPAVVATSTGRLTIRNDDTTLTFNLAAAVSEGSLVIDRDSNQGRFVLEANPPVQAGHDIRVDYRVVAGTGSKEATLDDITGLGISVGSPARGRTTEEIHISSDSNNGAFATGSMEIKDDTDIEAHETLTIELFNPRGATLAATSATLTIMDDDGGGFTLAGGGNYEYAEGRAGATTSVEVEVVLAEVLTEDVTIHLAGPPQAQGLTGIYGSDYTLPDGLIYRTITVSGVEEIDGETFLGTIPAGDLSGTFTVATILGDDVPESDENEAVRINTVFRLPGIDQSFDAAGSQTRVNYRIRNDDHNLSIGSPSVTEGDMGGTAELVFDVVVTNSPPEVTLEYEVYSASTTADVSDYGSASPSGGTVTSPSRGTVTISEVSHSSDPGRANITVPVTGDLLVEPDETVAIRVFSPSGEATSLFIPDSAIGIGTIRNDDYKDFSIDSPEVAEGATGMTAELTFMVTLSERHEETTTVDYAVTGGTAESGTDYVALATSTLTFARNETSKQVTVTVRGDELVEGDETVEVTLSNPTGGIQIRSGAGTGTGTIRDDDSSVFSIAGGEVLEGTTGDRNLLPFTVSLEPAATGTLTVEYTVTGGTAMAGTDFEALSPSPGTVSFTPGQGPQTITLTVLGNESADGEKTVTVTLSNPSGNSVLGTSTATSRILDDDVPVLSIDSPSVNEGDTGTTVLEFTVGLDRLAAGAVTFDYETRPGIADPSTDYGAITPPPGSVTIPENATSVTISVAVNGDDVPEDDETVVIAITAVPSGVTLSTDSVGTGTILNDDFPAITVGGTVEEGAAGASTTLTLGLDDPLPGREVTVDWTVTMASTAVSGTDYTGTTSGTARFPAGATTAEIGVMVQGDDLDEDDRTVVVRLSNPANATLPAPAEGTFTIRDDDDPPTISIVPRSFASNRINGGRISEIGINTPVEFQISLDAASGKTVTADFAFGGTAIRGTENLEHDYTIDGTSGGNQRNAGADSGTVTFAPGETGKERYITVNGNDVPEPVKTVVLRLANVQNAVPASASGTLTIVDDDGVTVEARVVGEASREEANGQIEFAARLSNDYPYDRPAMVDWALTGAATVADGDYASASGTSGTFTFERGGDREKRITLQMREDTTVEADESVVFTLSNPRTMAVGDFDLHGNVAATVTIENDDFPELAIDSPSVEEGDGDRPNLVFRVTKTLPAFATGTVSYVRLDGTATPGTDFTGTSSGTLTFGPDETLKTITLAVTDDDIGELAETVEITLSAPNALAFPGGQPLEATGTITDNDDLSLSIAGPAAPVNEGGPGDTTPLPFTLTLSAPSSLPVMVDWALTGDLNNLDRGALPGSPFTIPAGSTSTTLGIPIVGDGTVERDERATVTLSNLQSGGVSVGFDGGGGSINASATVRNDDFAVVSVTPATIDEGHLGATSLPFVVSLDRILDQVVVIGHEVLASSTATVTDMDFDAPGTDPVAIAAGGTSATFAVQVRGDGKLELDETVVVRFTVQQPPLESPPATSLVSFTGGAASAEATGTIRNDDALKVSFETLADTVPEGATGTSATYTVTVRLNGESSGTTTVEVTTGTDTTAMRNVDYATATKELVFPPGVREVDYPVTVIGDEEDEPNEIMTAVLKDPSSGVSVASGEGRFTLTIEDDDEPMLAVDSPMSVDENASGSTTPLTFTVTLSPPAYRQVTVDYDVGGDADSDDFTTTGHVTSGTLVFAPGDTSKTIDLEVEDDDDAEPNEEVEITLRNPTGGAQIATGTGVTRINNDDASTLTIIEPSVPEGDSGTVELVFNVRLSPALTTGAVMVPWEVVMASSTNDGISYPDGQMGTLTFAIGDTDKTIRFELAANDTHGPDRMVVIRLGTVTGDAEAQSPVATGVIVDDDTPELSVDSPSVDEGARGTTDLEFTVTLDPAPHEQVTVDWSVAATDAMPDDWAGGTQPAGDTLTFAPGEIEKKAVLGVNGDLVGEDDEAVTVRFANLTGDAVFEAGGTSTEATGTIRNDDHPVVSVDAPRVSEGMPGVSTPLVFTVTLDPVSDREVTVDWSPSGGSANQGGDNDFSFVDAPGTLTFAAGASSTTISGTITGDDDAEPNETVVIELGTLRPDDGHVTFEGGEDTLQGTGTILNDDSIVLSVTAPAGVQEGADGDTTDLAFEVTLSSASAGPVTVNYVVGGTATADDYGTVTPDDVDGSLELAAGSTTATIVVPVRGDGTVEDDETVTVMITSPDTGGAITIGTDEAEATIRNDDRTTLSLSLRGPSTVDEGDRGSTTDLVFVLELDKPSFEDVQVNYALSGDVETGDYGTVDPAGPQIRIPAGDTEVLVSVPVTGDMDVEPDEDLTLTLSNLLGGEADFAGGADTLAETATIRNDDIPTFSISADPVREGASGSSTPLVFTVSLSPTGTVEATVDWALTGGTANQGGDIDYTGPTPSMDTLTFPAGVTSMALPAITVRGDDDAEPNETVEITLRNPTGGQAQLPGGASTLVGTGTIENDDSLTVSVDSPRVAEGDGTTELVFTMTLSQASGTDVTFLYEVTDAGTAESGVDYRPPASRRLTIPADETTVRLAVPVLDDDEWELDETVVVRISDARFGNVSDPDNLTIGTATGTGTIVNDDLPRLSIDSPGAVAENGGPLVFTVSLQAATSGDVTVAYDLGGTARAVEDYEAPMPASPLTIAAGAASTTLTVPLVNDKIGEPHETVTVTLRDPTGAALREGRTTGTGTIQNDDLPALTVAPVSVPEGDAGERPAMRFEVERADIGIRQEFAYEYEVAASSTAVKDVDFATTSHELVFPAGSRRETIEVTVIGDDRYEGDETVVLRIVGPGDDSRIATVVGTIVGDDIPTFSIDSPRVWEGDTGSSTPMTFEVSLAPSSTAVTTVDWEVLPAPDSTATGADYTASSTSGTLTFAAGETGPQTIDVITIIGDEESERNETVVIELTNPTGGAEFARGATSIRGVGTIREDDLPLLSIDSPEVFEGDAGDTPELVFTVSMSVTSPHDVDVGVNWRVTGGTATAGDDYALAPSGSRTIPAGSTTTTIRVPVTSDDEGEPDETVVIAIDSPNAAGADPRVILGETEGVGTIVNDDIGLSIAGPADAVAEGATGTTASLAFTVSLAATSSRDVTVEYDLDGTADSGEDYGPLSPASPFAIPAGTTTAVILVPVTGDGAIENDETVTVVLTGSEGAGIVTAEATGTILNDDVPDLDVAASSSVVEVDRGTTELPFTVTPTRGIPDGVTVTYRYRGVSGSSRRSEADGLDFDIATNTFQIASGAESETVPVTVFGDFDVEGDETVEVRFLNPVNDTEVGSATGTIVDNDTVDLPEFAVAVASPSVPEGGVGGTSTLTFTLTLSTSSSEDVTVNYQALGAGTAVRGEDYLFPAPAGRHVIAAGATSTDLVLEVVGDGEAEPDETVVVLFSVLEGATLVGDDTVTVTIGNDDNVLLSVDSPSVVEGASGSSTTLRFTVSLSATVGATTTVGYDLGGDAEEGSDYATTTPARLTIPAGMASTSLRIAVLDDGDPEEDETVTVTLRDPSEGAEVSGEPGEGVILDDDDLTLSIEPVTAVEEGAAGAASTTFLTFTVRLSEPTGAAVRFRYQVVEDDSTARAGVDYEVDETFRLSDTIEIPAGATSVTIKVPVIDDEYGEPDDDLVIRISEATGARIWTDRDEATGTIRNDASDPAAVSVIGSKGDADEAVFTVGVYPATDQRERVKVFYLLEGGTLTVERTFARAVEPVVGQDGSCSGRSIDIEMGELAEIRAVPDAGTVRLTVTCARGVNGVYRAHAEENTAVVNVDPGGFTEEQVDRNTRALAHVLAGIGRTVVANVVDLIWERAASHRSGGGDSYAMVGGRSLDTGAFAAGGGAEDGADALRAAVDLAGDLLGVETDARALLRDAERRLARGEGLGALGDWVDLPDRRDLAGRTRFAVSFQDGAGGDPRGYTVWGRGSLKAFESELDGIASDGDVIVGNLGLDYRLREDLLVGAVLSHAAGDVDYSFGGGRTGAVDTTLTSVHPYVHWISPTGLGLWGSVGYGAGTADLREAGQTDTAGTDIAMTVLAGGIRDELARVDGIDLAFKADIFSARTTGDGSAGVHDVDADVSRVRLAFEGSTRHGLERGRFVTGRFELGTRFDGGDAERGAGIDVAGGFTYAIPELGLDVQGRGSMLLLHEESGFEQWGLGFGVIWDPDEGGRGLSLSVEPVWNTPAANTADAMWNARPGSVGTGGARDAGASLNARIGYGMGAFGDRALVTVFGELGNVGGDGRLRLGTRFRGPEAGGSGLGLELYGERRDRPQGPDDSVFLKGRLDF